MGQFVPKGRESRRHRLTREQLKWTDKDTQIVEEHKRAIANGEPTMNFLDMKPPVWTEEHDKIVSEYERKKALGQERDFVIVPRDE